MTFAEELDLLLADEMRVLDFDLRFCLLTQQEYDEHVDALHKWANEYYNAFLDGEA